jgi:DNA modification methylase
VLDFKNLVAVIGRTPYYQDNSVVLYNCDCREILPLIPENAIDIVLTDPPYGIDYQSARRTALSRKDKIVGDNEFPLWLFDMVHPSKAMFVFCRWDVLTKMPIPKSFIAWDKGRHSMGDLEHEYGRQWEGIAFYPFAQHKFINRPKDVIRVPCIPATELKHPNEKPVALLEALLVENEGDIILDPFAGSGGAYWLQRN